jgi:hypothetical protein
MPPGTLRSSIVIVRELRRGVPSLHRDGDCSAKHDLSGPDKEQRCFSGDHGYY